MFLGSIVFLGIIYEIIGYKALISIGRDQLVVSMSNPKPARSQMDI
jgi:hypothetical protein